MKWQFSVLKIHHRQCYSIENALQGLMLVGNFSTVHSAVDNNFFVKNYHFFSGYYIEAELQIVGLNMVRILLFTPLPSPLFGAPVTFLTFPMNDCRRKCRGLASSLLKK